MSLNVAIGRRIEGREAKTIISLPWESNIGAFIVGRPGSGKSHVIASLLTQYALKDVFIAVGEYNADPNNKDSLIYRTNHIPSLRPSATSGKEFADMMLWLQEELKERQSGRKERVPMVVVFDEFFAFSNTYKPPIGINRKRHGDPTSDEGETIITQKEPSYWDILMSILSDLRKNNIRVILSVQEPAASAGTSMRQARDMFRYKLIMNLGIGGSKLLGIDDKASQQLINKLPPGIVFLRDMEDMLIGVPFPINPQWIERVREKQPPKIKTDWTIEDAEAYLEELMQDAKVYIVNKHLTKYPIEDKDAVIELLVMLGWSNNAIIHTIKGNTAELNKEIRGIRTRHNL